MRSDAPLNSVPITTATGWSMGRLCASYPFTWGEVTAILYPLDRRACMHASVGSSVSVYRCRVNQEGVPLDTPRL